jgi:DNA-directed RNA polymerase specialized sigma24 family protein
MGDQPMDTPCMNNAEPSTAPGKIPTEGFSSVSLLSNPLYSEMSLPVLAEHCTRELNTYCRGEPCTDTYGVELLRRATMQGNQEAWAWVHHCFGGVVLNWLRRHPQRAHACRLESEEHYVARAFERFWQATTSNQQVEFNTLAAGLRYLRASLHGAILDTLRADARRREIPRLVPGEPGEPHMEDVTSSSEVWDSLKTLLSDPREERVAYLLFHCGLKPREILQVCPQEFDDVREVYSLQRTIMERLLRNADLLRWRLS